MIYCLGGPENAGGSFVIKPNQAISWQSLVLVYTGIATVTFTIGVSFYLIGLTLVLPFSGIEILALGAAFYLTAWRGGVQEVIIISKETIVIERGRQYPESRETFPRAWVRVVIERSWNSWYPSRLLIRSHGRAVEVGTFLNEEERCRLAEELAQNL